MFRSSFLVFISCRGRCGIGGGCRGGVYWLRGCRFELWQCLSGRGILGCCAGQRLDSINRWHNCGEGCAGGENWDTR